MALTHTFEKAFSVANGMRRNVPKIVVTVTDGRSQDEVKKGAEQLQHAGESRSTAYRRAALRGSAAEPPLFVPFAQALA